jgi:hypothetical protein
LEVKAFTWNIFELVSASILKLGVRANAYKTGCVITGIEVTTGMDDNIESNNINFSLKMMKVLLTNFRFWALKDPI